MPITRLPQVDKILRHQRLSELGARLRRDILLKLVREELERLRQSEADEASAHIDAIVQAVVLKAQQLLQPGMRRVVNGTGVVLNTNLGRAPLAPEMMSAAIDCVSGYCNLEIDLKTGKRGKRSQRIEELLKLLTGAQAALVVNNNAAAVLLCVNALARGKEVVVSRGELIEIGGSFRLPDVIEASGGILKEVGTTNRTRISDYRKATGERTGLYLRCHRSNFSICGFTEEARMEELAQLAADTGVPLLEDLGSGMLVSMPSLNANLADEPTVPQVVAAGCDLICFSADKLLGGPQAGIIVGKQALIEKLSRHPLYRALRLDKLTLSLLERTLIAYLHPQPQEILPALAMLTVPTADIARRAEKLAGTICDTCTNLRCQAVPTAATAGGGSLPEQEMDSMGVCITHKKLSAARIAQLLRSNDPPIIGIVHDDRFTLDFRTIDAVHDEHLLLTALRNLDAQGS